LTIWLVYKTRYFKRSGHAIAHNSSMSSLQFLEQCDRIIIPPYKNNTRATEAEVAGMPNSLLNNAQSEMYSFLAKKFRCSSKLKPSWIIILSQILFTI